MQSQHLLHRLTIQGVMQAIHCRNLLLNRSRKHRQALMMERGTRLRKGEAVEAKVSMPVASWMQNTAVTQRYFS